MVHLMTGNIETVNMQGRPTVREPTGTFEPEGTVGLIMPVPGRGSAYPHDAAGGRVEGAFFGKTPERVHR